MKWDFWQSKELELDKVSALAKQAGLSLLLSATLWSRDFCEKEQILSQLADDVSQLHDPFLLAGMQAAVVRLKKAIADKEYIAIYGDYDVDGITATVLLHDYLKSQGVTPLVYIPDRMGEGYGLNLDALSSLKNAGVSLIVTVDCGVSAMDEAAFAKELGLDLIITDHHKCGLTLPLASAVVCPQRDDCNYPNKHLAGVAVAFKLVCAMENAQSQEQLLSQFGDLVAAGTVSDVMPLTGENRSLVTAGLIPLKRGVRLGFHALMALGKVDVLRLSAMDISFSIAPKINAAGRMGDAMLAFSLLSTEDLSEAQALSKELFLLNEKRIETESKILDEALTQLENTAYTIGQPIVVAGENWHKGVLGVVAARLSERFSAPTVVLSIEGSIVSGSCRSAKDFDLFAALCQAAHLLDYFGGHKEAAGLTLDLKNLDAFRDLFFERFHETALFQAETSCTADFIVDTPNLLDLNQIKSISRLEPCGAGNERPRLILEQARLVKVQGIGDNKHVKLQVEKWGVVYDCVFFKVSPEQLPVSEGDLIDLLFTPSLNHFRGKTTVQFLVKDLKHTSVRQIRSIQAFCQGAQPIAKGQARVLAPSRTVFAQVWRRLGTFTSEQTMPLESLLKTVSPDGSSAYFGQTYLCLKVFAELGLISLNETGQDIQIAILPPQNEEKRALESATLMKHLEERGK